MPLNINLLAEEQQQAAARQAEPLKVVLRIALLVFIVVVLAIGGLILMIKRFEIESARTRQEWKEVQDDAKRLAREKKDRDELHRKALAYYDYANKRLLWGNQLEMIRRLVPQEIYLTEITGSTDMIRTLSPAGEGQPAVDMDVETRVILIRGRVRGAGYIDTVENWLKTLRSDLEFKALVVRPETDIALSGELTEAGAASPQSKEYEFTVRCQLKAQPLR